MTRRIAIAGLALALWPFWGAALADDKTPILSSNSLMELVGEFGHGTQCPDESTLIDLPDTARTFQKQRASDGRTVLVLSGAVNDGDAQKLENELGADPSISEIWLHSPGGVAEEGIKLGRVIRAHKLATRTPARYQCISACSLAFLGGAVRRIDAGAAYGVHVFRNDAQLSDLETLFTADYSSALTPQDRAVLKHPKDKNYAWVKFKLGRMRILKLQKYIHDGEQYDALTAADHAVYMSQMGVSRLFLPEVLFQQRSTDYDDDYDLLTANEGLVFDLMSQGATLDRATVMLAKALAEKYPDMANRNATYLCPTPAQLSRYNVVNVQD